MDRAGAHDSAGEQQGPPPSTGAGLEATQYRDAVPSQKAAGPVPPPRPAGAPRTRPLLAQWLSAPRPQAEPGIWRYEHQPPRIVEKDRIPNRQLISGAIVSFLIGWLAWSLLWNGYLGSYWLWPLLAMTPDSWRSEGGHQMAYVTSLYLYYALVVGGLAVVCGRMGHWDELGRRAMGRLGRRRRPQPGADAAPVTRQLRRPEGDPIDWPELREVGAHEAADRLQAEAQQGVLTDLDHTRIERMWKAVRADPDRLASFVDTVRRRGATAYAHPSGERDLPVRRALHDLRLSQVRIGQAPGNERNQQEYRGAGIALDPTVLGTSLLAVGPPGAGKTQHLVRPVVESLCLQALLGQSSVVAVTAEGSGLLGDEAFDVVIRMGRPDSRHGLDLYCGVDDPDEAASLLAEGLVGDLTEYLPGGDSRRAAVTLAQLIGPFRAAYGRFPRVAELRDLLEEGSNLIGALRARLEERQSPVQLRELEAFQRHSDRHGDVRVLMADRVALLDRSAFAGQFGPPESSGGDVAEQGPRLFSMRALERPVRVRVDLPERGHSEASRILARLLLAQFSSCAVTRADTSLFATLVVDDAAHVISPESLRGLQRLRSAHAGVVLTLRTLDDVPAALRGPLLSAVGCRMACAGISPRDGGHFSETWGTEWVETRDVTNRQIISDEPFTKVMHSVRRLATGRYVTAESVTVRKVQRERWSASDLAHSLPPEHAVLSLTTTAGKRTAPILTRLGN
ncbi:ATP-binding protein [Streptomyces sp. NPDC005438]|uniref:ATP-binding protein n=1 Tax=Streptomyces sp. NPDC005438 TaxID=3156880 RepID=UPI0033A5837D